MPTDALYFEAAKIVETVCKSKGTIKSLCFSSKYSNKKALVALVSESCKHKKILEYVLTQSELAKTERRQSWWLLMTLLQDFLYKGKLSCKEKLKAIIMNHKARIHAEFVKAKIKFGEDSGEQDEDHYKFVRVNQLKCTSLDDTINEIIDLGFERVENSKDLKEKQFCSDEHIPYLLVFHPKVDFSKMPLYQSGKLIIQDKASCMPAFILNPPTGSHVIDSCSAPGNKTSHLSAILNGSGKIFAFERDPKRFNVLNTMLSKAGCSNVQTLNADFLKVNPNDKLYADVEYCLVDPSCSGSGIIKKHEAEQKSSQEKETKDRLDKLSKFQIMIIRHAMKFPSVKKVVYSTCSIHEEENEQVVQEILEKESGFTLESKPFLTWHRRGLDKYAFAQDVIRADPTADKMHGFFVALFVRK